MFLIPKKSGEFRPVINLRSLNKFVKYQHFKMEGIRLVKDLLTPGHYLGAIDLKDAYFLILIHHNHQK